MVVIECFRYIVIMRVHVWKSVSASIYVNRVQDDPMNLRLHYRRGGERLIHRMGLRCRFCASQAAPGQNLSPLSLLVLSYISLSICRPKNSRTSTFIFLILLGNRARLTCAFARQRTISKMIATILLHTTTSLATPSTLFRPYHCTANYVAPHTRKITFIKCTEWPNLKDHIANIIRHRTNRNQIIFALYEGCM